jgi:hypothetical protein
MDEDDSEDTFLTSLIAPARAYVERRIDPLLRCGTRTETFSRGATISKSGGSRSRASIHGTYSTEPDDDATYTGFVANLGFPARIFPADDGGLSDAGTGGRSRLPIRPEQWTATSEEYLIGKRAMLLLIGHFGSTIAEACR